MSDSPVELWQPATDGQERRAVQSGRPDPGPLRHESCLSSARPRRPEVFRVASACGPASFSKDLTEQLPVPSSLSPWFRQIQFDTQEEP